MAFYTDSIDVDHRSAFKKFLERVLIRCEIMGYHRAARVLRANGMPERAKYCIDEAAKLREALR